jgi:hypothetical protein
MLKFSGFLKNVSIILLTATLLIVYAFLRVPQTGILFDKGGMVTFWLTRDQFFYYCFLLGVGYNLVFHLFKSQYLKQIKRSIISTARNDFKTNMITWWQFMNMSVNLFFMCFILFVGLANNAQDYSFSSVTFIPVIGLGPLLVTLIALPVIIYLLLKNLKGEAA